MIRAMRALSSSMRGWLVMALGIAGCEEPVVSAPQEPMVEVEPAEPVADPVHARRERVRAVLEESCGRCHIGGSSEQPAALGVFDLREPDFAARMTDSALEGMPERLDEMGLDPDDAAAVLAYVSVVFADRRSAEPPPPQDC
jgi:cytochrome c5